MLQSPEHARKTRMGRQNQIRKEQPHGDERSPHATAATIWFRPASAVSEFGHPPEASNL